jgi:hypothetical protein
MNWRKIFIVSFGMNILLTAWIVRTRSVASRPTAVESTTQPAITTGPTSSVITQRVELTNRLAAIDAPWPRWEELESPNWRRFRTNLLAIGCPGETTRDILRTAITRELFDRRRQELAGASAMFWDELARQGQDIKDGPIKDAVERVKAMAREYDRLLQEVLSGLPDADKAGPDSLEQQQRAGQFSHLDPKLRERALKLESDFIRKREELEATRRGRDNAITPEGVEAVRKLTAEHQRELSKLMGPDSAREWRLRSGGYSNWAGDLRGLEVTPEEIRQVAEWRLAVDDAYPAGNATAVGTAQQRADRAKAEADLNQRIKSLLGTERFNLMQQANQPGGSTYNNLYDIGERFDLPEQTVSQAVHMREDADQAAGQLRANPDLTIAQRLDALRAVRRETEQAFQKLLGGDAYATYLRHGGQWISTLSSTENGR